MCYLHFMVLNLFLIIQRWKAFVNLLTGKQETAKFMAVMNGFALYAGRQSKNLESVFSTDSRFCGGDEGDRTPYLLNAIQALSQVSYTPTALSRTVFSWRRALL